MTVKLAEPNVFDKFLRLLGKKRGVFVPENTNGSYGQYGYATGKKENFLKAFLRPAGEKLPDGFIDIFECRNSTEIR